LIDVGESIGEVLQLGTVVRDRHVALRRVAELGVEGDGARLFVVAEEAVDGVPDLMSSGASIHDDAEELQEDRAVDPGKDGVVVAGLVRSRRGVRGTGAIGGENMGGETVAAEGSNKELTQLRIVGVLKVEGDGN
jgi:hypothetical protein